MHVTRTRIEPPDLKDRRPPLLHQGLAVPGREWVGERQPSIACGDRPVLGEAREQLPACLARAARRVEHHDRLARLHGLPQLGVRIAAAPLAVAAALGWTHMGRTGWAMGCVAVGLTMMAPAPLGDTDAIQRHDQLAQRLADASPAWVDAAWDNGPMRLEPSAVVLSAVLQGTPAEDLRPTPTRPLLLLLSTTQDAPPQAVVTGEGWAVLRFPRAVDAQAWINQNGTVEGAGVAGDWVGALFPGDPQDAAIHTP